MAAAKEVCIDVARTRTNMIEGRRKNEEQHFIPQSQHSLHQLIGAHLLQLLMCFYSICFQL